MTERQFREREVQIAHYQLLSREVTDPLAGVCFGSLSKNLRPTCEGIATSVGDAPNEVRARGPRRGHIVPKIGGINQRHVDRRARRMYPAL
jgi:hypothetical protein